MNNKTLSFIKKYPLSILLGIIVINLITISAHLTVNSKLAFAMKLVLDTLLFTLTVQINKLQNTNLILPKS